MTDATAGYRPFDRSGGLGRVIMPAVRMMGRFYYRARVFGDERIPADRPVIYVGKHPQSFLYLETVLLGIVTFWDNDRPAIRVLEKRDTSIHRTPLLGWMRRKVNAIPATEEHALEALAHGESLLIYPGGTRELYGPRDQLRWAGRTGFARLAIAAGVPVLPIAIAGADDQHFGRLRLGGASIWLPPFPLPVSLDYHFGHPLTAAEGEDAPAFARRVESATAELLARATATRRGAREEAAPSTRAEPRVANRPQ